MPQERAEFLKGTLDMLILKVVAAAPFTATPSPNAFSKISKDFFQVPQGPSIPRCTRLEETRLAGSGVEGHQHGPRGEVLQADAERPGPTRN